MLYLGNLSLQSSSEIQFSSLVGVLSSCVDGHTIEFFSSQIYFIAFNCRYVAHSCYL
jgi:hypothetical protein